MRPLHMEIQAFGPYAGKVAIPFDKLGDGLFLVTGDTGAGKTTIFDALAFALYGETSGSTREARMLRSDFAPPQLATYVKLRFSHRGEIYVIERNPAYTRAKLRGEGSTEATADASLLLPDGKGVAGLKEVTNRVEELLGIDVRQFKQIVMIAQGEFLKLLHASSKEREGLLGKVFGTENLGRIQARFKARAATANALCVQSDEAVLRAMQAVRAGEGEEALQELAQSGNPHQAEACLLLLEASIARDEATVQQGEAQLTKLRAAQAELAAQAERAHRAQKLHAQWQEAQATLAAETARADDTARQSAQLEAAERAQSVGPHLAHLRQEEEAQARAHEQQQTLQEGLGNVRRDVLRAQEALAAERARDGEREAKATAADRLREMLPRYAELATLAQGEREGESKLQRYRDALEGIRGKALKSEGEIETLRALIAKGEGLRAELMAKQHEMEKAQKRRDALGALIGLLHGEGEMASRVIKAQARYSAAEKAHGQAARAADEKEYAFLRGQAGLLAQSLRRGEPCPVCGALDHPQIAVHQEGVPSEEMMRGARAQVEREARHMREASQLAAQESATWEAAKAQVESALREVGDGLPRDAHSLPRAQEARAACMAGIAAQKTDIARLQEECDLRESRVRQLPDLEEALRVQKGRVEQGEGLCKGEEGEMVRIRAQKEALSALLPHESAQRAHEEMEAVLGALRALRDALEAAQSAQGRSAQILAAHEAQLAQVQGQVASAQARIVAASEAVAAAMGAAGFADRASYEAAQMQEEPLRALRAELEGRRAALEAARVLSCRLAKEQEETPVQTPEQIAAQREGLDGAYAQAEAAHRARLSRLEGNVHARDALREADALRGRRAASYEQIARLSRTANGEIAPKMTLEQYALTAYLDRILERANVRLSGLSDGRFELMRQGEGDQRRQFGLELNVMDHYTGRERSVKSLSGGESFKASLAMALGLSDVVRDHAGGVQIDALFIDEGFGALDAQSLEQAVRTLQGLATGARCVGVISHVAELKERIQRQIVVSKTRRGSSVSLGLL